MRIGKVIGTVTLSRRLREVPAGQFVVVQPEPLETLRDDAPTTRDPVVAYDALGAGLGEQVGIAEGREASMPFYPALVPFDVYCAAILESVEIDRHATESDG